MFDGPLKEVQIVEVSSTDGGALKGTFDLAYEGHSVGLEVGASLSVVEVGVYHQFTAPTHSNVTSCRGVTVLKGLRCFSSPLDVLV